MTRKNNKLDYLQVNYSTLKFALGYSRWPVNSLVRNMFAKGDRMYLPYFPYALGNW